MHYGVSREALPHIMKHTNTYKEAERWLGKRPSPHASSLMFAVNGGVSSNAAKATGLDVAIVISLLAEEMLP